MPLPSEVFRRRLREVRQIRGWTQQELATELDKAGVKLGEFAIARLESGKRRGVTLDEVIAVAAVLGVSPLHMLVPLDDTRVHLAPLLPAIRAVDARAWLRGQRPLRQADERVFYTQTPDSEADWFPLVPGPWRFRSRKEFEAGREKWERPVLSEASYPLGRTPADREAEDIPVRRPNAEERDRGEDHETA
jgi:transcriptional regulator with XRE-family HTH domain